MLRALRNYYSKEGYAATKYVTSKSEYANYLITNEKNKKSRTFNEIIRDTDVIELSGLSYINTDSDVMPNFDDDKEFIIYTSKESVWVYYSFESGEVFVILKIYKLRGGH